MVEVNNDRRGVNNDRRGVNNDRMVVNNDEIWQNPCFFIFYRFLMKTYKFVKVLLFFYKKLVVWVFFMCFCCFFIKNWWFGCFLCVLMHI